MFLLRCVPALCFLQPAEPLPLPHPALRTRLWKAVENQKWQKVCVHSCPHMIYRCCLKAHHCTDCLHCFHMLHCADSLAPVELQSICLQQVKDLVALTEQRRGEDGLSVQDYLTILQAYAVGEQWTDFADLVETMRANPAIAQHEPVLAEMLGICAVGRQWDSALSVLSDMLENEIEPFLTSRANGFTGYGGFLRIALQDPDAVFLAAVRGGYNDIGKWLHTLNLPLEDASALPEEAARYNQIPMIMSLNKAGYHWTEECLNIAAENGHIDMIKVLLREGCEASADTCTAAAVNGNIDILQFLYDSEGITGDEHTYHAAAESGSLQTLQFLQEHNCPYSADTIHTYAASDGNVDVLKWMQQSNIGKWDADGLKVMLNYAGVHDKVDAVKWLREQGAAWPNSLWHLLDDDGNAIAATTDSTNTIDADTGITGSDTPSSVADSTVTDTTVTDADATAAAAPTDTAATDTSSDSSDQSNIQAGCWRLEALQYALSNGCEVGEWPLHISAALRKCGYSDELNWLLSTGAISTPEAKSMSAAATGDIATLSELKDKGQLVDSEQESLCSIAAANQQSRTIIWLLQQGLYWGDDIPLYAAKRGDMKLLAQLKRYMMI
jgi:Ankyrin repeats (3 copies)